MLLPRSSSSGAHDWEADNHDAIHATTSNVLSYNDVAQKQAVLATGSFSSPVKISAASGICQSSATTGTRPPNELLASSSNSSGPPEAQKLDPGPAILVTNDLFQQMPDENSLLVAAQGSQQWQVNNMFETQASIEGSDSAARALSAPSDQYSSLVISSTHSSNSRHSDCCSAGSAHQLHLDAAPCAEQQPSEPLSVGSPMLHESECHQHDNQGQAFHELFDSRLLLTTQEDILSSSDADSDLSTSDMPSAGMSQIPQQDSEADFAALLPGSSQTLFAVAALEPKAVQSNATDAASDRSIHCEYSTGSSDASAACSRPITQVVEHLHAATPAAVDTVATLLDPDALDAGIEQVPVKREPLTAAVSTAQLEVMGWDMFADTLGTFRLLSDTDSDAESTANLLPEPSELGPITPEAAVPEPRPTHSMLAENSVPYDTGAASSPDDHVFATVERSDLTNSSDGVAMQVLYAAAPQYSVADHTFPVEWEYHALTAESQGLTGSYPGMTSDAEEFDGHGTGCAGQHSSCLGRLEQCVTCYPCATCACYPHAALRPGRRHQKSRLKRVWASIRAKGSACVHPSFPHEWYN